jgi:hypothetical protein
VEGREAVVGNQVGKNVDKPGKRCKSKKVGNFTRQMASTVIAKKSQGSLGKLPKDW